MSDEKFFERLRADAGALRYRPDEAALARIRALIRQRIERPTVAQVLAGWFRPLAAALTVVALAAAIGVATLGRGDESAPFADRSMEISMAGETYSVGN
jgi:anti-sigma factor RsiW